MNNHKLRRFFLSPLKIFGVLALTAIFMCSSALVWAETSNASFPLSLREQKVGAPSGTNAIINNHNKIIKKIEILLREIQNKLQQDKCLQVDCKTYKELYRILAELTETAGGAKGNLYATFTEIDNEIFSARLNVERLGFFINNEYSVVGWQKFFMSYANNMGKVITVTDLMQTWKKKGPKAALDKLSGKLYKKLIISGMPEGEAKKAAKIASKFVSVKGLIEGGFSVGKTSNFQAAIGKAVISALKPYAKKSMAGAKKRLEEYKKGSKNEQHAIETLVVRQGIFTRLYDQVKGIKAELKKERDALFSKAENCGIKQRRDCSGAYQKALDAAKKTYDSAVKAGEEKTQSLIKEFNEIARRIDQSGKQFISIDEKAEKIQKEQNDLFDDTAKYEAHEKTISDIDEKLRKLPATSSAKTTLAMNKLKLQQEMQQLKSNVEKYRKLEKQYKELRSKTEQISAQMEREMKNENHLRQQLEQAWQARKEEKKKAMEKYKRQVKDAKKAYEACRAKTSTVAQYRRSVEKRKTKEELVRLYIGFLNMEPFTEFLDAQKKALQRLGSVQPQYKRIEGCRSNKKDLKDAAIRGKGEEKKKLGEGLGLSEREASQALLPARKEKSAAEAIDISGCWDWFPLGTAPGIGMSIIQSGRHVVATVNRYDREDKKIEIVYTGTFDPPKLELIHRLQDISILARLPAPDYEEELYNIETYSGISRLLASGIESRLQLHVVKENTNLEFHMEGTYIPFDSRLDILGVVSSGMSDWREGVSFEEAKEKLRKSYPPSVIMIFSPEKDDGRGDREFSYMVWFDKVISSYETLLKKASNQLTSEWGLNSITITDSTFMNELESVTTGDCIWVKAKASSGCPDIRDHFEVTLSPEDDPTITTRVMLSETGPDTLEFRSPAEGVLVASVFEKKKKGENKNPVKEPLKAKEGSSRAEKSKKAKKSNAKREKKTISGHKEKQEIIAVGAQGGQKKVGFRTALNLDKTQLIAEKEWLQKELKSRKKTMNNLGQAKALFIRHYLMQPFPHNKEGLKGDVRKLSRLEITQNPELSGPGFKLNKTENVLFIRKAKEQLNKEIEKIQTDIKRIMKELEVL